MMKYTVMNPAYGYLNEDHEFKSFDLQDAAFFTADDIRENRFDTESYTRTPFTDEQIADMPFDIPNAKSQEELSARFNTGLDDLSDEPDVSLGK